MVNDHFYKKGWTDGLPIILPTEERIEKMLAGMPWRDPDTLIGLVPPFQGKATLRKVAINAVMAGAKSDYLPVIIAALEATLEERYGLHHRQTTTHAAAPLLIISGPIVKDLNINYGNGCFGPGWRSNATIGRALTSRILTWVKNFAVVDFVCMPIWANSQIVEHQPLTPESDPGLRIQR